MNIETGPCAGSNIQFGGIGETQVWVESDRLAEYLACCTKMGITGIGLSRYKGFQLNDLEFLRDWPFVRSVTLLEAKGVDVAGLSHLRQLESLNVSESDRPLDLAQFPHLARYGGTWHKGLRFGPECRTLREISFGFYKSRSHDLTEFPALPTLEVLHLIQSPLRSLRGIGRLPGLRRLELSYLTKLASIADIAELRGGSLEWFACDVCRKLTDHEASAAIETLRVLRLNDCGKVPSIGFLAHLPALEDFRFVDTNVIDGDLRPVLRLKSVGFSWKRHYSHSREQIEEVIARRGGSRQT